MTNLGRLQASLAGAETPALLITTLSNLRWASGFTGSAGQAWVTPDAAVFLTDSRYTIQAREQCAGWDVRSFGAPKTLPEAMREVASDLALPAVMFETSLPYMSWQEYSELGPKLVPDPGVIKPLRMVKAPDEIRRIEEACKLADACMAHASRMLQPGVAEYDVGLDIEFYFRRQGGRASFDPIVASGPNSARPHAKPSERKFERGDFVTLDLGAELDGYCSDITRTFVVGQASDRHREVYGQVLEAEQAAIAAMRPGMTGVEADAVAREVLQRKDLAQYFGHGLGHGLGIEVHDPGGLSTRSKDVLAEGQVWTVEPGVYIEGFGGVRIEDDVVVTADGVRVLTHFERELTELS